MAVARGTCLVHLQKTGKERRLVLAGPDNAFDPKPTVTEVKDTVNQTTWTVVSAEVKGGARKHILLLTIKVDKEPKFVSPPEVGSLTITLTGTTTTVDPVPVVYVNDDKP